VPGHAARRIWWWPVHWASALNDPERVDAAHELFVELPRECLPHPRPAVSLLAGLRAGRRRNPSVRRPRAQRRRGAGVSRKTRPLICPREGGAMRDWAQALRSRQCHRRPGTAFPDMPWAPSTTCGRTSRPCRFSARVGGGWVRHSALTRRDLERATAVRGTSAPPAFDQGQQPRRLLSTGRSLVSWPNAGRRGRVGPGFRFG
jgi:hypothetical protein